MSRVSSTTGFVKHARERRSPRSTHVAAEKEASEPTAASSTITTRTWRPAREHAAMTAEHAGLEQNIKAWDHRDIHARADEISCV